MTGETPPDPRLENGYVATVADDTDVGALTVVGVVHDHPSSTFRVQRVLEEAAPDVLGLELPPIAVPLYRTYADDERRPPAFGGEMSAAIQAAATDDVVGIDGPSIGFLRELAHTFYRERPSSRTLGRTVRGLLSVGKTAAVCRVAASVTERTSLRVEVDEPTDHDTSRDDPPERQAADERRQIRTATSVLQALEPSPSSRCRSRTRERHMARRLTSLRRRGDVVAVVGIGHFDAILERIEDDSE